MPTQDGAAVIGGRYRLGRRIGAGGMAEVWLAADLHLNGRPVAVKRLPELIAAAESDLDRARREAYAVAGLHHPNVVAVTDFLIEDGAPFIVMEYVAGRTLAELCRPQGLPPGQAAHLAAQVAAGLAVAHHAGLVHRDVKPANVLVSEYGGVKLADFGIARRADGTRLTADGSFTGTVGYLAPEIFANARADPASDMWALGVTLFEALEGRPAYEGDTAPALIYRILHTAPPRSSRAGPLAGLLDRLLQHDPAARPHAATVAAELAGTSANEPARASDATVVRAPALAPPPFAPPPGTPPPGAAPPGARPAPGAPPPGRTVPPRKRRNRAMILVAVPAVVLAAAIGIAIAQANDGGTPSANPGLPNGSPSQSEPRPGGAASESATSTEPSASGSGTRTGAACANLDAAGAALSLTGVLGAVPSRGRPDATERGMIDDCTVPALRPRLPRLYGRSFGAPGTDRTGQDGRGRTARYDISTGGPVLHLTMTRQPDGDYAATAFTLG